jgi:glycosyltransferase involved in cell wall biosynthesis/SAM-dependent methyltransferase
MNSFYKSFEDRFRGSRELIAERLRVYLPLIDPIKNIYPNCLAIDLGCGRGEWIELLNSNGFQSHGVDLDEGMLEASRVLGLSVELKDALEYLISLPDESVAIVSGFHIAEHLPFDMLRNLIAESFRVLKPAGLLILETPNPENISVGSNTFYIDPTHVRPLPPVLLSFLPEFYGYARVTVFRLNSSIDENSPISLLDVINGASPDYSVIAQKNAETELLKLFDSEFHKKHGFTSDELAIKYELAIQVPREHEITTQRRDIQEQLAQARSHNELEQALHRQHVEREHGLSQQLQTSQQELQHLQQDRVSREQEVGAQLFELQKQASREVGEQARQHLVQVQALYCQHVEREQALHAQLQSGQQELRRQDQDAMQREKEFTAQCSQNQQAMESMLHHQVQREQDMTAQLLSIRQQAEQQKIEQVRLHAEQVVALQHRHAELEQALIQQRQAEQEANGQREQAGAQRELGLASDVAGLRGELQAHHETRQLQDQQHDAELCARLAEHQRLMAACAVLEEQLKAELLLEQQTGLQLHQSLANVRQSLASTHASLTWRMTAPLRVLAAFIVPNKNAAAFSLVIDEAMLASEIPSIHIQQPSIEPIMIFSAQSQLPISATTLPELLVLHDHHFVRCAYQTLLGRVPDPEGLSYYLNRLRLGFSKIQILKQIFFSAEGKIYSSKLPGLKIAIRNYKNEQYPLIGWLFKIFNRNSDSKLDECSLRIIENKISILSERSSINCNDMNSSLLQLKKLILDLEKRLNYQSEINLNHKNEINLRFNKIDNFLENNLTCKNEKNSSFDDVECFLEKNNSVIQDINNENLPKSHDFNNVFSPENYLVSNNKNFFFNLSTSHHWKAPPVGIIRVERELAKYLNNFLNVKFVIWDQDNACFNLLNLSQVSNILSDEWVDSTSLIYEKNNFQCEDSKIVFNDSDTFISIGLDWDLSPMHEIANSIKNPKVTSIFACYDIVPILFPEFCVRDNFDQLFKRHFVEMAHCGNKIFTISDSSKRDLTIFFEESKLEIDIPLLEMIPLASYSALDVLPELSGRNSEIISHVINSGEYIIYVSSLESRKNHRLLINIWRELYRERGDKCPQLVIVGMKGWGVNDLLQQIPRMPVYLAGKINWLQDVDDALLMHLYKNCSFSLFPSIYEGWGLAASEAMAFGKICVISNNSSLGQATQFLMPSFHHFDYFGWKNEIEKILDNNIYKADLEEKIRNNLSIRTWNSFSKNFCDQLLIDK